LAAHQRTRLLCHDCWTRNHAPHHQYGQWRVVDRAGEGKDDGDQDRGSDDLVGECRGQRHAEDGVGTQPALVFGAIQLDQDRVDAALQGLSLSIADLRTRRSGDKEPLVNIGLLALKEVDVDLGRRAATVGEFTARDGVVRIDRAKDGRLNLASLVEDSAAPAPVPAAPAAAPATAEAPAAQPLLALGAADVGTAVSRAAAAEGVAQGLVLVKNARGALPIAAGRRVALLGPQGASFDDLGRGDEEGKRNISEVSDQAATRGLEVLRQISSTGYLRKRLPQELVVLQGGMTTAGLGSDAMGSLSLMMTETTTFGATALSSGTVGMDARVKAKMQGYEGDPCGECGNYTLVRNGTCMKCNTCGGTSG
jgi:hypothetical protein